MKNIFRPPVIEDWDSDDDSEVEFIPIVKDKTVRPSTEKIKFVKFAWETIEKVETPKQNKHYPRENQRNWNNLMSQRLGIITKSGKINTAGASVNTVVRPVNTAGSKTIVNIVRVNDTTARERAVLSVNKKKEVNAIKPQHLCFKKAKNNETVYKDSEDRMQRKLTTIFFYLKAEQDSGSGPRCQDTILGGAEAQSRFEAASKQSNDPPLSRVNTLGSGEDSMKLMELMEHCTHC
ncbi:hypothetical protein Tco_0708844 [Tanacetum coccineum]